MAAHRAPVVTIPVLAALAGAAEGRAQVFRGLGIYAPDTQSTAHAAFGDGLGAIGSSYTTSPPYQYRGLVVRTDTSGNITGSTLISATGAVQVRGVSRGGGVVVGSMDPNRPTVWDGASGDVTLLGALPGAIEEGYASGCSASGTVVVGRARDSGGRDHAFRKIGAGPMEALPHVAGAFSSSAAGVSASGRVVAGDMNVPIGSGYGSDEIVRWRDGVLEELGWLDPVGRGPVYANAISADGRTIIGFGYGSGGHMGGLRYTEGVGIQDLPAPCGQAGSTLPSAVSANGAVIVGGMYCNGSRAMLWTPTLGAVDLQAYAATQYGIDFGGWTLTYASGVSTDGLVIVGAGTNPAGGYEAWMLRLPSIPGNCRPEINGDGAVNVQDFLAFLSYYAAGDARADFDADGAINVQDFLLFLSGFAAGCPG